MHSAGLELCGYPSRQSAIFQPTRTMSVSIGEGGRQRGDEESCVSLQSRLGRVLSSVNRLLSSVSDSMCEAISSAVTLQTRVRGVTAMARSRGRSRSRTPLQNKRVGNQPSRGASRSRSRAPPQNRRAENQRSQEASPQGHSANVRVLMVK